MASPSVFGRAGIGIQDCTLPDRELRGASALVSASLAASAGAGTAGDVTGTTTESSSITTPTSPTAESSPITTPSITRVQTSIVVTDFVVEADFRVAALAEIQDFMVQSRSTDL